MVLVFWISLPIVGLGPAVAVLVVLSLGMRQEGDRIAFYLGLKACGVGVLVGMGVYGVVVEWANVLIPVGWLWEVVSGVYE